MTQLSTRQQEEQRLAEEQGTTPAEHAARSQAISARLARSRQSEKRPDKKEK
eukprot:m.184770 g.184770  ORF g.184770 m.184770 type:complete len:52 (-) comp16676_c0_seq3:107-262(-)